MSRPGSRIDNNPREQCSTCHTSFSRMADLQRHLTTVHAEPQFKCPVRDCSRRRGFHRKDKLNEHLRSYHHIIVTKTSPNLGSLPGLNGSTYSDIFIQVQDELITGLAESSIPFARDRSRSLESAPSTHVQGLSGTDGSAGLRVVQENNESDVEMSEGLPFRIQKSGEQNFTKSKYDQVNQSSSCPSSTGPRFACPYYKRDRENYQSPPCIGPGWATVHRLK